jgi:hypothetical protein
VTLSGLHGLSAHAPGRTAIPNPQKLKGDRAELGVQALIRDLLGWPARRKLGAGRLDDVGDIDGVPDTVIQVADWKDAIAALRLKPLECEVQQARAGATFGATFLRLRGGGFRVILTPEQWSTYARESSMPESPCTVCGSFGHFTHRHKDVA